MVQGSEKDPQEKLTSEEGLSGVDEGDGNNDKQEGSNQSGLHDGAVGCPLRAPGCSPRALPYLYTVRSGGG